MTKNTFSKKVGRRIASARVALGWNQADLAEALGVHPSTVSFYETGRTSITVELLSEVAAWLDTSPQELVRVSRARRKDAGEKPLGTGVAPEELTEPEPQAKIVRTGAPATAEPVPPTDVSAAKAKELLVSAIRRGQKLPDVAKATGIPLKDIILIRHAERGDLISVDAYERIRVACSNRLEVVA